MYYRNYDLWINALDSIFFSVHFDFFFLLFLHSTCQVLPIKHRGVRLKEILVEHSLGSSKKQELSSIGNVTIFSRFKRMSIFI